MSLANNATLIVAWKELVDLFRDRRTVMLGLLMGPLLFPVLFLGIGSIAEKRARTQLESVLELPVIGAEHAPNLVRYLATRDIEIIDPPADPERPARAQEHDVVLRIRRVPGRVGGQPHGDDRGAVRLLRQDARIPVERVRAAVQPVRAPGRRAAHISRGVSPEARSACCWRSVTLPRRKRARACSWCSCRTC